MPSTVENLAPAFPVVQVTHSGEISASDLRSTARQVLPLLIQNGSWLVLTDCTAMTRGPKALDLLNLMDALEKQEPDPSFRQALLWPHDPQARIDLDFWKTAETNEGLRAKAFGDRDAALAWLAS